MVWCRAFQIRLVRDTLGPDRPPRLRTRAPTTAHAAAPAARLRKERREVWVSLIVNVIANGSQQARHRSRGAGPDVIMSEPHPQRGTVLPWVLFLAGLPPFPMIVDKSHLCSRARIWTNG